MSWAGICTAETQQVCPLVLNFARIQSPEGQRHGSNWLVLSILNSLSVGIRFGTVHPTDMYLALMILTFWTPITIILPEAERMIQKDFRS